MKYMLIALLALGSVAFTGCADSSKSKEMCPASCTCEKCVQQKKESRNMHPVGCTCEKCSKEKMEMKK
jgi:hypothetical protein